MPLNWVQRGGLVFLAISCFLFAVLTFATAISELDHSAFGFLFLIVYGAIGAVALVVAWKLLNRVFFSKQGRRKHSRRKSRRH
jgi:hypothetical protein